MKTLPGLVIHSLIHFFYPSFCLHCNRQIFGRERWICALCFKQIEWIEASSACRICGKLKQSHAHSQCIDCRKKPRYLMPMSSCFFPEGPAYVLYQQLLTCESEDIAKTFACLLIVKWNQLPWPLPDAIIPIPDSRLNTFSHKRQANYLIARAFSKLLGISFRPAFTTREKGVSYGYRAKAFTRGNLTDKKVLLFTDMARDSDHLQSARSAAFSLFPKTLYTLALFDRRKV